MSFYPHPSRKVVSPSPSFEPSLTVQADKDRTDIRNIVQRAMRGKPVHVNVMQGSFRDISDAPTYTEALNLVVRAQAQFDALPSKVRDRFANDPLQLMAFLADKENEAEAIKLGLVKTPEPAPQPPDPVLVRVVPDTPAK